MNPLTSDPSNVKSLVTKFLSPTSFLNAPHPTSFGTAFPLLIMISTAAPTSAISGLGFSIFLISFRSPAVKLAAISPAV